MASEQPLDQERFPRATAYLASLPEGLHSFPASEAKASLLHAAIETAGASLAPVDALPPEFARLLKTPPPPNDWIPEVSYVSSIYALSDLLDVDDEGVMAFEYRIMASLAEGPLYRFMFAMMTSRLILKTSAATWSRFHRGGTSLTCDTVAEGQLRLTLGYPDGLFDPLFVRGFCHVWQAIIDRSRTPGFEVRMERIDPTEASYLLVATTPS